jgi:hypothetical protein
LVTFRNYTHDRGDIPLSPSISFGFPPGLLSVVRDRECIKKEKNRGPMNHWIHTVRERNRNSQCFTVCACDHLLLITFNTLSLCVILCYVLLWERILIGSLTAITESVYDFTLHITPITHSHGKYPQKLLTCLSDISFSCYEALILTVDFTFSDGYMLFLCRQIVCALCSTTNSHLLLPLPAGCTTMCCYGCQCQERKKRR